VPETRAEWIVFFAGVALIVVLVASILLAGRSTTTPTATGARSASFQATTVVPTTTGTRPPSPGTTTTSLALPAVTTTETATTTSAEATTTLLTTAPVTLRLEARRDTWLSVRRDARAGPVLYEGTLAAGNSETFTGATLWVRFGAASNVAATLNGHALSLPSGTYSVPVTTSGLGHRHA
jgi:cytoskeletal protein RodZ